MPSQTQCILYQNNWLNKHEYTEILDYLLSLWPIWEMRNQERWLLRPVYWLGNWQFACLDYYHPPKGIFNRCVHSDPYPDFLQAKVKQIESLVRSHFLPRDLPYGWQLNTCLINYYGDNITQDARIDCARVGEHKDFEPGPVASLSFGERALFQFVDSNSKFQQSRVTNQMWLEDNSLQIFGGDRFKKKLFHRVQRVEKKRDFHFQLNGIDDFDTRRINLTFRFVPPEHIYRYHKLPNDKIKMTLTYVEKLALHSETFRLELAKALSNPSGSSLV